MSNYFELSSDELLKLCTKRKITESDEWKDTMVNMLIKYDNHIKKQEEVYDTKQHTKIKQFYTKTYKRLNSILEKWYELYDNQCSEGKMRYNRGRDIENFVINTINSFGNRYHINLVAVRGADDKKKIVINKKSTFYQQVDVHIYYNDKFISVVECKSYLDSCYYARACDDFIKFREGGYILENYVFTLEDSMKQNTRTFNDCMTNNICDKIFCLMDGKRSSKKPIYNRKYTKKINIQSINVFINTLCYKYL